jgi:DNA primase
MDTWVDFNAVKARVSMRDVIACYGITSLAEQESGEELRGPCPIHSGSTGRTFSVNLQRNIFRCFACRARGNVLDLVAALDKSSVKAAAAKLATLFPVTPDAYTPEVCRQPEEPQQLNQPLSFTLRVDTNHVYGKSRGVGPEVAAQFGAGLCLSKGTFSGRYVIPLHDGSGELIGYAGRAIGREEPRYLYPPAEKGFRKELVLFNLHRARTGASTPVFVVASAFDCMRLAAHEIPSLALLGACMSEEQRLLLSQHFERAILVARSAPEAEAMSAIAVRLVPDLFVRLRLDPLTELPARG